jgi:hypothetical protein
MSSNDARSTYLDEILAMHPIAQASEIIEYRNVFFGRSTLQSAAKDKSAEVDVEKLRNAADRLRAEFWSTTHIQFIEAVRSEPFASVPELNQAMEKLVAWSARRNDFDRMHTYFGAKKSFLRDTLKRVVTLTAREAADEKRLVFSRIQSGELRGVQRQAVCVAKHFPEVFAMEHDWLSELSEFRRIRYGAQVQEQVPFRLGKVLLWSFGITAFLIIAGAIVGVVIALIQRYVPSPS